MTEVQNGSEGKQTEPPKITEEGQRWLSGEAKGFMQLGAALCHRVNNRLTSIIGYAQMAEMTLQGRTDLADVQEDLATVREKGTIIAKDMAAVAQTIRVCNPGSYRFESVDLAPALANVLNDKAGISFVNELPPGGANVLISREFFNLAIEELLKNSQQAGATETEVRFSRAESGLTIKITDNGEGIELAPGGELGDLDVSTRTSSTNFAEGMSLGYFKAKTVVFIHGGSISAGNREDGQKGARVEITLPISQP